MENTVKTYTVTLNIQFKYIHPVYGNIFDCWAVNEGNANIMSAYSQTADQGNAWHLAALAEVARLNGSQHINPMTDEIVQVQYKTDTRYTLAG